MVKQNSSMSLEWKRDFFVLCHFTKFPDRMLAVKIYCVNTNRTSEGLATSFKSSN